MTDCHARAAVGLRHRPARSRLSHASSVIRKGFGFTSLIIGVCLPLWLHAQSTTFNGTVALSSQLVDRGQVITRDTPILQGAAAWTFPSEGATSQPFPSGWSLDLSGSTEVRSAGHIVEALAQASHYWSLPDDWQMQVSLLYYRYPGNNGSTAFDRAETGINWSYRDVLTIGLSVIHVIGAKSQSPRGAVDIDLHWPLARHFSFSAGAGITQSPMLPYAPYRRAYADSYHNAYTSHAGAIRTGHYSYGHMGLSWSNGPWRVELDRIVTAPETQQQWANPGASHWVATILRSF